VIIEHKINKVRNRRSTAQKTALSQQTVTVTVEMG